MTFYLIDKFKLYCLGGHSAYALLYLYLEKKNRAKDLKQDIRGKYTNMLSDSSLESSAG